MILLIDHYDSFVHNLARYIGQLGFQRCVMRFDAITSEEITTLAPSHLIFSPGPCSPNEIQNTLTLIQQFAGQLPMLGVCLGHQAIAQVFGASITRATRRMHGMQSSVILQGKSPLFNDLPNTFQVGRYHSLIVSHSALPSCLTVTALSPEQEIMALQHQTLPIFGVQFHPESVLTEYGYEILRNFLQAT